MANIPFIINLQETIGANSTGTLSYQVATNEDFTVKEWRQDSTGGFSISRIYDSRGNNYTNANSTERMTQAIIADVDDANNGFKSPPIDLEIPGGTTLYFDVRDDSGASNVVSIFLAAIRKTKS